MLAALTVASLAAIASQTPAAQKADEGGAYEIDFAPLPDDDLSAYKLEFITQARSGAMYKEMFIVYNFPIPAVRRIVKESYEKAGWTVRAEGETRLIVEGIGGSPVVKMEVKLTNQPPDRAPKVKRLEKK
jgi:hypothetical protein